MALDDENDWTRNGLKDMDQIWISDPVKYLCERHRDKAKNRESTDCRIEDLRIERFPSWENSEYFRRCIVGLANIHEEIETAWGGNIVRLTPIGLQSCRRFPVWQKDF